MKLPSPHPMPTEGAGSKVVQMQDEDDRGAARRNRREMVRQVNANQALEGLAPDSHDRELQHQYVEGSIGIGDLLNAAHEFASTYGKSRIPKER